MIVPGINVLLCADHVNDLLADDQKFRDQYHNYSTGVISKMYGFDIYEYPKNPYFTQAKAKVAFTGTPAATDKEASVFFFVPRMFKAKGSTKMYYSKSENDTLNKRNLISFTNRWIALPQKAAKAVGAIVSTHVAG